MFSSENKNLAFRSGLKKLKVTIEKWQIGTVTARFRSIQIFPVLHRINSRYFLFFSSQRLIHVHCTVHIAKRRVQDYTVLIT